jgi:hypothetical protein
MTTEKIEVVPLHTLQPGDVFVGPGMKATATVSWQSPKLAERPEGQMMVTVFRGISA